MATPTQTVVHPALRVTSRHRQAATWAAVHPRPTTAATAPTPRPPTIIVRRATITLRLVATTFLQTETILPRVPSLPRRPTPPRAALLPRVVTRRQHLAPQVADLAAARAAAVAGPTQAVEEALTVGAAVHTVAVDITNLNPFSTSQSPLPSSRSGLFVLSLFLSCPFRNLPTNSYNSPPSLVLNIVTQEV